MMVNIPIPVVSSYSLDVSQSGVYTQPSYNTYDATNPTVNINLRPADSSALAFLQGNQWLLQEIINDYHARKAEAELRKKYPALQSLHDQYETLLALVKDANNGDN